MSYIDAVGQRKPCTLAFLCQETRSRRLETLLGFFEFRSFERTPIQTVQLPIPSLLPCLRFPAC